MKKFYFSLFIIICVIGIFVSLRTLAQGSLSIPGQISGLEEQISLKVSPQVPEAGKPVELTVNAYGTDISKAKITWKVNGVVAASPGSLNTLSVNMGEIGKAVTVEVMFEPFNGPLVSKKVTLIPGEIDLIWETDGYNPPFYKGKTFYGPEKNVRVVAIPNIYDVEGKKMNAGSLDFKWSKNREIEGAASGLGKNVWSFKGSILLKDIEIEAVAGSDDKVRGKSSFNLFSNFSELRMYQNSAIYGVLFNKSLLGRVDLNNEEQTIEAYPYSVGVSGRYDPALKINWLMNGKYILSNEGKAKITVRNTENQTGEAKLGVNVKNLNYLFDETNSYFFLQFTKKDFEF